jgi:hypothetical protein
MLATWSHYVSRNLLFLWRANLTVLMRERYSKQTLVIGQVCGEGMPCTVKGVDLIVIPPFGE